MGRSCKSNRCNSRHAAESWPFPPSTMIRSGNRTATKLSSVRAPKSFWVEESRKLTSGSCNGIARLTSLLPRQAFGRDAGKFAPARPRHSPAKTPPRLSSRRAPPAEHANTCAGRPRPCWRNRPGRRPSAPDNGGNCPCPERRFENKPSMRQRASR